MSKLSFTCAYRSEIGILTSISLLNRIIRQITSNAMLQEFVFFLLGEWRQPETPGHNKHQLRYRLIEHCDHLSDEVNIHDFKIDTNRDLFQSMFPIFLHTIKL